MVQMTTIELPRSLINLPEQEQRLLLRAGLYEAGRARLRQVEAEIAEAEAKSQRLESRYGMSFAQFESEALPMLDTFQVHEDYNDWFFWQSVLADRRSLFTKISEVTLG